MIKPQSLASQAVNIHALLSHPSGAFGQSGQGWDQMGTHSTGIFKRGVNRSQHQTVLKQNVARWL